MQVRVCTVLDTHLNKQYCAKHTAVMLVAAVVVAPVQTALDLYFMHLVALLRCLVRASMLFTIPLQCTYHSTPACTHSPLSLCSHYAIHTITTVNSDVLALVDFYTENGLIEQQDDGTPLYPVTADGLGPAPLFEKLYQQFVVAAFTVEGPQAARFQAAQEPLAGILGLPKARVAAVHAEIGSTVLNQFFKSQLSQSTSLGARETAFLASIGAKLNMPSEEYDALVMSVKRKVLKFKAESAFQKPQLTPDMVKNLRETCAGVGVDMSKDLGLEEEQLRKLFLIEAGAAVESASTNSLDEIEEIAEACGLSEDQAQDVLGKLLQERYVVYIYYAYLLILIRSTVVTW
jgi:hypothetical protein